MQDCSRALVQSLVISFHGNCCFSIVLQGPYAVGESRSRVATGDYSIGQNILRVDRTAMVVNAPLAVGNTEEQTHAAA